MAGGLYTKVTTAEAGEVILALDRNNEHDNHITNRVPAMFDDDSSNILEMQTTVDPYPASSESLPTSLEGEFQRLRYVVAQITGESSWYIDPNTSIPSVVTAYSGYQRPNLEPHVLSPTTAVTVAQNTTTTNQTTIVFPDGNIRSVTEDPTAASKYRTFSITAIAEFTSGTEESGLRSGVVETNNNWYAIYAVKSLIDSTKFILAGDTTVPIATNISTLNTRYGTNSWVYLGTIRNGDQASANGDILQFYQSGPFTYFLNSFTTGLGNVIPGLRLAVNASATSLAWSYTAGTSGVQVPNNILTGMVSFTRSTPASVRDFIVTDTATTGVHLRREIDGGIVKTLPMNLSNGITLASSAVAVSLDIGLAGFFDSALGFPSPLV